MDFCVEVIDSYSVDNDGDIVPYSSILKVASFTVAQLPLVGISLPQL